MKYKNLQVSFILVIFFISGRNLSFAENSLKMGYINALKIFDSTIAGKASKKSLEEYIQARQKLIDQDEAEIKKLDEDLHQQKKTLGPDEKKEKEALFQNKLAQFQKKAAELNKEIQVKRTEVLREFNKTLEEVVKSIGEKEGYQLILDKNPDIGTVVYMLPSAEISDKVIEEMDKLKK